MDARSIVAAANLGPNILNVWVARGLVPGMSIGKRGLRRDFDLKTATAVMVMAELTKFGLGAAMASSIAADALGFKPSPAKDINPKLLLIGRESSKDDLPWVAFEHSEEDVAKRLGEERRRIAHRSSVFLIVDLEMLAEKMRVAHDEWAQSIEAQS